METLIAACPPAAWVALLTVGRAEASMLIASTTAAAAHSRSGTTDREPVRADAVGRVALFCVATRSLPALFVAPIAAWWASCAPVSVLRPLFAPCLGLIAVILLLRLCT